ncbi:hypothetical protein B484DRAFT_402466 [Ochromonadaceae sp. CCMP2298]|nr:hypothetical protein B484DRAFT_402466 [Ochromonadaceae sp. CCMP2298]
MQAPAMETGDESDPEDSVSDRLQRAKVFEAFKRSDKAEQLYRGLISSHPQDFRAYFNLARLLAGDGDGDERDERLAEAEGLLSRAALLSPLTLEVHSCLAAVLIKTRQPARAVEACDAGLRIQEDSACSAAT